MTNPVPDALDEAISLLETRLRLERGLRAHIIESSPTPMHEPTRRVLAWRDHIVSNLEDALEQLLDARKLVGDVLNRTSRDQWSPDPRI